MKTIRALAQQFGLSRSTLLYYDRLGVLRPDDRTSAHQDFLESLGLPESEIRRIRQRSAQGEHLASRVRT